MFVYLTGAIAWKKSLSVFLEIIRDNQSTSSEQDTSYKKAMLLYLARRAAALAGKKKPPEFLEINRKHFSHFTPLSSILLAKRYGIGT